MTGIVFLNYNNRGHNAEVMQSINQCRGDAEVLEVDMLGIAAATNYGLRYFFEEKKCDYVAVCANDIVLPPGWLNKMVHDAERIPKTGINAIYCTLFLPEIQTVNGVQICPNWEVFGVSLYPRTTWEKVGYLNTAFDPYGVLDMDYCYRTTKAGLLNYYIANLIANHIGLDTGEASEYRKMKDKGLQKSINAFGKWQARYDSGQYYLPYEQETYLLEMNQMYGSAL